MRRTIAANYRRWNIVEMYGDEIRQGTAAPDWGHQIYRRYRWRRPWIRIYLGHMAARLIGVVPEPCTYFTMLRDPIDRALSLYHYCQQTQGPQAPRAAQLIREYDLSLEDIYRRGPDLLRENPKEFSALRGFFNNQLRCLCWGSVFDRRVPVNPDDPITREAGEAAYEFLARHFLVGFQSHFDESIRYYAQHLGWRNPEVHRARVTESRPRAEEVSGDLRELVEHWNRAEVTLYEKLRADYLPRIEAAQ